MVCSRLQLSLSEATNYDLPNCKFSGRPNRGGHRGRSRHRRGHCTQISRHGGGRCALWSPTIIADRKSTRLNSSHSQISYAVFCLKKKKISQTVHGFKAALIVTSS